MHIFVVVVQSLSCVQLFVTPWTTACQASLSITIHLSFLKLLSIKSVMPSNHLIFCCPFSSGPQSFWISGSFPKRLLFSSGEKSIGASALVSVFPMNIQGYFPLGVTDLVLSKALSGVFFSTTVQKHQFFGSQPSLWSNSHIHINYWKNFDHSFEYTDLCGQSNVCF